MLPPPTGRGYSNLNISRSILKESKYYLYDTGAVEGDLGAKLENLVACSLLSELHFLEDITGSRVALHFLRNKEKKEVDFLVMVDNKPMFLVEVKVGDNSFSPALFHFKKFFNKIPVLQVVLNLRKEKEKDGVKMIQAKNFLRNLKLNDEKNI